MGGGGSTIYRVRVTDCTQEILYFSECSHSTFVYISLCPQNQQNDNFKVMILHTDHDKSLSGRTGQASSLVKQSLGKSVASLIFSLIATYGGHAKDMFNVIFTVIGRDIILD